MNLPHGEAKVVTVWRGLNIDNGMPKSVAEYITEIKKRGSPLGADGGKSGMMRGFQLSTPSIPVHESDPEECARRAIESTREGESGGGLTKSLAVCVCGDREGAHYYATRSHGKGILIRAKVSEERLVVDGRDFLYFAVSRACKASAQSVSALLPRLRRAFSDRIEQYIEVGRKLSLNHQQLIRLTDFIVTDRLVRLAHLANRIEIRGRHGTAFRSAFGVLSGILPSEILDVIPLDGPQAIVSESTPETISIEEFASLPPNDLQV